MTHLPITSEPPAHVKVHPNADPWRWGFSDAVQGKAYANPWRTDDRRPWRRKAYLSGFLLGQERRHALGIKENAA